MASAVRVVRNLYRDSVSLMRLSSDLARLPGITRASAVMASPANIALLREAELCPGEIAADANDVIIVVAGNGETEMAHALAVAQQALAAQPAVASAVATAGVVPRSQVMALAQAPNANLALISTPGAYAAAEAEKALRLGLNVMLFSDNIALAEEVALKRLARRRGPAARLRRRGG